MDHERGVSEIVGAILLVALVILAMMIVAVALLSQPPPQEIPQVNALAGNNSDTIFIKHNGGDSLTPFETIVRIDGNPNPVPNDQILLRYENGTQTNWTTQDWSVGTTLVIPDTQTPTSVSLVYTGGSSQALLLTATFTEAPPSFVPTLPPGSYYTIISSAGAGGSISPSGSVQVPIGGVKSFSISPAPCHRINEILVDGVSQGAVSSYTFTNVQADHTISASFVSNDPAITATAGPNGAIIPNGTVPASCHGIQSFTITPSTGYYIQNVLVDGSSVGPVTTYTFSDIVVNHTISASFSSSPPYCTPVVVSFTAVPTSGAVPLLVTFTDTSTGYPDTWQWDFGDGSANSTLRNPTYTYTTGGVYSVTLTATNTTCGTSGSRTVTDLINATSSGPVCGTISGYKWNDLNGNGVWDTGEPGLGGWVLNVSEKQGNNWIYLATTVTNSSGYYIFSGLTYHPANDYLVQETLQTGWQETYPASGSWEVHLEPPGPGSVGQPPKCYKTDINFGNRQVVIPSANFYANPLSGTAPLAVQFTDTSTGNPTQWAWDFNNDGTTDSTLQNPLYTYGSPGTYTVRLSVTNAGGSASLIRSSYITVSSPLGQDIYLTADKTGSLQNGGYIEFTVTGMYSYVKHGGTNYNLAVGDHVKLQINTDGKGTYYSKNDYISDFSFDSVTFTLNEVNKGTGSIGNIWISQFSDYVSTLTLVVPAENDFVRLRVNGITIIDGNDNRVIRIINLIPDSTSEINLNSVSSKSVFYKGGATSYTLT